MTRTERDEHLLQDDEMMANKTNTSRKNIGIAGLFYIMAFIMFFTELRIVSLLHCIFGTMFMFFLQNRHTSRRIMKSSGFKFYGFQPYAQKRRFKGEQPVGCTWLGYVYDDF